MIVYQQDQLVVWSQPAARRLIRYTVDDRPRNYFLSFPRMLFAVNYEHDGGYYVVQEYVGLAFAPVPDHQTVYTPRLPNHNNTYWTVCLKTSDLSSKTLPGLFASVLGRFWQTDFTQDLYPHPQIYDNIDFPEWQRRTRADPTWVPGPDFFAGEATFDDFINGLAPAVIRR